MNGPPSATAVIPVKPLDRALGRLGTVLSAPERRDLQWEMLGSVLSASIEARLIAGVIVVTTDPSVRGLAHAFGARVLVDHHPPRGMNAAVVLGCEAARDAGAEAALILTADLPLARPVDLDAIVERAGSEAGAVCVPSRDATGTNALLLRGPRILDPQLGPGSLALHEEQARRRGVRVVRHEIETLALDIDTAADLAVLGEMAPEWSGLVAGPGPALEAVR